MHVGSSWRAGLVKDVLVAAACVASALVVGTRYLSAYRASGASPLFYQEMFGPAVMEACGRGFINPLFASNPSLDSFLAVKTDTFDCRTVAANVQSMPFTPTQDVSRYLLRSAALAWRVLGIRWSALDWLSAGLLAVTSIALYIACRLVAGPMVSAVVTLLAITSPLHHTNLPGIRDYSKAPFFVVAAAGLGWLMGSRRPHTILVVATIVGALLGVGFGFRTDVVLYLPPFLAGLLVCSPQVASAWRIRLAATALCIVAFLAISWPILRVYSSGQTLWHVALLGLTTPFDEPLGIRRSLYDFGDQYRDGYVSVVANSYWLRAHHAVSAAADYSAATGEYYRRLFATFPADFVTRAWAATLKCLDLPFDLNIVTVSPSGIAAPWLNDLYWYRWWALSWFQGLALPILIAFAIALWSQRRVAAIFLIGFVSLSAGITSLQFQQRHIFHLEAVVYWLFAAAIGWVGARLAHWRSTRSLAIPAGYSRVAPSLIFIALLVVVVALPVAILRFYQSRTVTSLFDAYSSAPSSPLQIDERTQSGVTHIHMPDLSAASRGPASAQMIVTTFDARACGDSLDLTVRYTADPLGEFDFTRTVRIDQQMLAGGTAKALIPAYFADHEIGPRLSFVGLELPEHQRSCIRSISRLSHPDSFPLLLTTLLPADWRTRPLYERLDPVEFHPSTIVPFVGKVWYRTRTLLRL